MKATLRGSQTFLRWAKELRSHETADIAAFIFFFGPTVYFVAKDWLGG